MKITLTRKWQNDKATTGELVLFDDDKKELFRCFVLENARIGSKRNADLAVPFGSYRMRRHFSPKFNPTLDKILGFSGEKLMCIYNDALNVPASAAVLLHWGNTEADTLGCPLLGRVLNESKTAISQSRSACKEFYNLLLNNNLKSVEFEIIDAIGK